MDIRKERGGMASYLPGPDEMETINRLSKAELKAAEVYTFAVRLCDNEIDRDFERFDQRALETLSKLFVGKTGIFDHQWSAAGQMARIYRTEVCCEGSVKTAAGDGYCYLKGYAYMLRSEKNAELIAEIEAGIKKEVSVGCSVRRSICSVCGEELQKGKCRHSKGRSYSGKLCYAVLQEPTDAYEWSFVAVPAQRQAGVIKRFGLTDEKGLHTFVEKSGDSLLQQELAVMEEQAALGRAYLAGLRQEVLRLAGLCKESMSRSVLEGLVERMDESELLEYRSTYRKRMEALFSISPQLKRPERLAPKEGGEAFRV